MDMANAKARVLSLVRRGAPVAWCPSWMRLGSLLYLGLWGLFTEVSGSGV